MAGCLSSRYISGYWLSCPRSVNSLWLQQNDILLFLFLFFLVKCFCKIQTNKQLPPPPKKTHFSLSTVRLSKEEVSP